MRHDLDLLPDSTLRALADAPRDRPVLSLLRHAARGPLPEDGGGAEVPLTAQGERAALLMGAAVADWLRRVQTSPLRRTMQTAAALATGAGQRGIVSPDTMLGDPGVYIDDPVLAGEAFQARGAVDVTKAMIRGETVGSGFVNPAMAAQRLLRHMMRSCGAAPGLYAFVTHDSILSATIAHIMGVPQQEQDWPRYLEAMWVWPEADGWWAAYRQERRLISPAHTS
ncbi:histidine phosphatase family protein [Myxococcota bacterium]|nr:histidine phosphatase family protein [Myxococcota bacterium]